MSQAGSIVFMEIAKSHPDCGTSVDGTIVKHNSMQNGKALYVVNCMYYIDKSADVG